MNGTHHANGHGEAGQNGSSGSVNEAPVVFVTGSSSGNGRGIALAFAAVGASVFCADIKPAHPAGETPTHKLISTQGGRCAFVQLDVTKDDEWQQAVQTCMQEFGRIDVLVNNAGILGRQVKLHEMPVSQWDLTLGINLTGIFLGMRHVIPVMLKQPLARGIVRGKIVNIASNGASYGVPLSPAYTASKAGVVGLTKQAAVDYSRDGININSVSPGLIGTPMSAGFLNDEKIANHFNEVTPAGRYGLPHDVAQTVMYLAGPASDYCYGTDLVMDGGYLCT